MSDHLTPLLEQIQSEHARLDALLARVPEARMTEPGAENELSIKDLLAHITFWERRTMNALQMGRRGERPPRFALPGEDSDTMVNRVNAQVFAENRQRPLAEVMASYRRSYDDVLATVGTLSEQDLTGPEGLAAVIGWPVRELIAGDTYEHYREHIASIQSWLERATTS